MLQHGCLAAMTEKTWHHQCLFVNKLAVILRPVWGKSFSEARYLPVHESWSGSMLALLGNSLTLMLLWTLCMMNEIGALAQVRTGTREIRADAAVNRCERLLTCFTNDVYSVAATSYPFTCVAIKIRDCMHEELQA